MSMRYPMPEFHSSDIFSVEREPGSLHVTREKIMIAAKLTGEDMNDFWSGTLKNYANKDWTKIFYDMQSEPQEETSFLEEEVSEPLTDDEKTIASACWGLGEAFRQVSERRILEQEYKNAKSHSDQEKINQIEDHLDELNIVAAKWQIDMVKMLSFLGNFEKGKTFITNFWQKFADFGQKYLPNDQAELKSIKNGIFGLKAAFAIVENCGYKAYMAYPEQDAIKKIDLWARRDDQVLAIQVKSRANNFVLSGFGVRGYEPTIGQSEEEIRDIKQRHTLLTSAREYNRIWYSEGDHCQILPYWLNVPVSGPDYDQDPITGQVTFPSNYLNSRFVKALESEWRVRDEKQ